MSRNDDLWDDIADLVIDYTEERGRGRNQLRAAYLDSLSHNGWRSREFESLISTLTENYREIEDHFYRDRDRDGDTLKRAIPDMIDGHFAKSVLQDRQLSDELDDDVYDEMTKAAKLFDRLVGNDRRGGRDRDRRDDRRGGRDRYDDYDDRRGGRDRGRRDDRRGGSIYDDRRASSSNLGRERRSTERDDTQPRRSSREVVSADPWDMIKTVREMGGGPDGEIIDRRREIPRPERPVPTERVERPVEKKVVEEPVVKTTSRYVGNGPDYTKAKPHLEFFLKGEHWMAFHISKWKLTEQNNDPLTTVPTLYNVLTHIKYFVMNESGVVREEHVPVSDENRYVAHELMDNPNEGRDRTSIDLRALSKKTAVDEGYTDIGLEEEEVDSDRLAGTISCVRSADLTEFVPTEVDSIQSVTFSANAKAILAGVNAANQYSVIRTPLAVGSYDQLRLVSEVGKCVSLTDAVSKLRDLKSRFEPAVFNELDRRFSSMIIRAIRYQFQFSEITAMSFVNDWERALEYIGNKRGSEFAAGLASRLAPIVRYATLHIEQAGVQDVVGDLYDGQNEDGSVSEVPALVFVDFVAVMALRDNSDVLGLGQQFDKMVNGSSVTTTSNRLLSEVLRAVYRKATANASAVGLRVYLATQDGRVIEVIPYATRTENFILAKA